MQPTSNLFFRFSDLDQKAGLLTPKSIRLASELFQEQGFIWLKDALPKQLVQSVQEEYQRKYVNSSVGFSKAGVGDKRYLITVTVESLFNNPALYAAPMFYPLLVKLLGEDCVIDSFGSVCAYPGAKAQKIHADNPPLFESDEVCARIPCYALTVVVPLIALNQTVGTTAVWEKSHRHEQYADHIKMLREKEDFENATWLTPDVGDIYLMDYRLIHAGTPNLSHEPRPILYIVYSRPWFVDAYNFGEKRERAVKISKEEFAKVPESYRHLFKGAAG